MSNLPAIISARADQIAVIARKSHVSHVSRVAYVSLEGGLRTKINMPDISYFVSIPAK